MAGPPRRRVSLCLIVRNEEDFLEGCLASAADACDEIIVVDTGSSDDTVGIAEAAGARVVHFPWVDDFAAARNASIDAATGDFVLVLDADERLAKGSAQHIRRLIEAEAWDGPTTIYLPLIENRDKEGNALGADHMPRLWRRRPELRFTGRVHEQLGCGVAGLRRCYEDAFHVIHYGYDPDLQVQRGKRARNVTLLRAELAERPDDPSLHYYLAKEHYADGDDAVALAGFERVIADGTLLNHRLSSMVFVVECLRALQRPREAMDRGLAWLKKITDYSELWFVTGQAAQDAGLPIRAEGCFRFATQAPAGLTATAFRDPAIQQWRARLEQARALAAMELPERSVAVYREVRDALPPQERMRADLEEAALDLDLGDEMRAWALLEPLLETAPADATPLLLRFVQMYVDLFGLEKAYEVLRNCLMQYPGLLHQLPAVGAAVDLAEAVGDEEHLIEWLQICMHLHTPHAEHALRLARLLADRGDARGAREALARARALLREGG